MIYAYDPTNTRFAKTVPNEVMQLLSSHFRHHLIVLRLSCIGSNETGKTALLKAMFDNMKTHLRSLPQTSAKTPFGARELEFEHNARAVCDAAENDHAVYFPEKDIYEHSKGLPMFIEDKQTGFSSI
jgi:hypothetical protein